MTYLEPSRTSTMELFCKKGIPYHFKFFKGCLPQILYGSFLNTLTQIIVWYHPFSAYTYTQKNIPIYTHECVSGDEKYLFQKNCVRTNGLLLDRILSGVKLRYALFEEIAKFIEHFYIKLGILGFYTIIFE